MFAARRVLYDLKTIEILTQFKDSDNKVGSTK